MSSAAVGGRGFTLLELLVVLAIVGLLLVAAPSLYSAAVPGLELKATARDIAAGLREARGRAITENRDIRFVLDLEASAFRVGDSGRPQPLGTEIGISLLTARSEQIEHGIAGILFYPDGGSSGGRVTLTRGALSYEVSVNWLTGRVTVND